MSRVIVVKCKVVSREERKKSRSALAEALKPALALLALLRRGFCLAQRPSAAFGHTHVLGRHGGRRSVLAVGHRTSMVLVEVIIGVVVVVVRLEGRLRVVWRCVEAREAERLAGGMLFVRHLLLPVLLLLLLQTIPRAVHGAGVCGVGQLVHGYVARRGAGGGGHGVVGRLRVAALAVRVVLIIVGAGRVAIVSVVTVMVLLLLLLLITVIVTVLAVAVDVALRPRLVPAAVVVAVCVIV